MKAKEIHIGNMVLEICKQRGYKLSDVAKSAGVSKQTFNSWLKKSDWSVKNLFTISSIVGYDFMLRFIQPAEEPPQQTRVTLNIEVSPDKTNEVLGYIQDKQLYKLIKN